MSRKAIAILIMLLAGNIVRGEAPFVDEKFEDALKDAGKANKLVMIDFFATWCAPCKVLDKRTWPDKNVQAFLAEHAICLKLDGEKETNVAGKYNIDAFPTIVFIKPDGTEVGRIVGFVEPDAFLKRAGEIVAGAGQSAKQ